jgi:hypothetical protein
MTRGEAARKGLGYSLLFATAVLNDGFASFVWVILLAVIAAVLLFWDWKPRPPAN